MISVGVVGYGYWGPNLARNFAEASEAKLGAVCDVSEDRLAIVGKRYPGTVATSRYEDLLEDSTLDAVAISTPVSSHYDLALKAFEAGKHVLLTKPMTSTSEESRRLIEEAEKRNLVLMVDHTFIYTGAVHFIKDMIENGGLGDVYYYDSVRVNLGLFQHDVDVIWDLAVHDLSIMEYVLPSRPVAVSATGIDHFSSGIENIAYLTLFFENKLIAHIHVNWLAPVKIRRTLLGGSRKMIVYDDLDPSEKVKVYDKGVEIGDSESVYRMLVSYRTGDMWAPKLDTTEALRFEIDHFVDCVQNGTQPLTDGRTGLRIVRLLEAATESMKNRGQPVEIEQGL